MNDFNQRQCPHCYFQQAHFFDYCGHCGFTFSHICQSCHKKNPADFNFCGFCGCTFANGKSPFVSPAQASPQIPTQNTAYPVPSVPLAEEKSDTLEASAVARMTEQRRVAVVFCDICGFTAMSEKLDAEDVSNVIQPLFEKISQVIHKYEGIIEKFIGDAIMALFGVPISHEDDPERSLLAALEIRDIVQEYRQKIKLEYDVDMNMRIGINVGDVVAGSVGSDGPQGQTVMGDAINTAARVEQNARPGNILVTEAVHVVTHSNFDFESRDAIIAKGKTEPLKVFELIDLKTHQQRTRGFANKSLPFIGRQEELGLLKQEKSELKEQSVFIGVEGEAGLGKSRLLKEWRRFIKTTESVLEIKGSSTSYSQKLNYFLLQSLLKSALAVHERTPKEDVIENLKIKVSQLDLHSAERTQEALEYLLFPETPSGQLKYLSAERLKQLTFKSLVDFFLALAPESILILAIEDLHWADPLSLEWLLFFQQWLEDNELKRISVSATWRPKSLQGLSQINSLLPWKQNILLSPLSPEEACFFIHSILEVEEIPSNLEELYQVLIERSECNPYYIEEVLKELLLSDVLLKKDGEWLLTQSVKKLPWPSSLKSLTISHFDHLPTHHRELLQVAAVIGSQFSLDMLVEITEKQTHELQWTLSDLVLRGYLWSQKTKEQTQIFGFQKSLVQDIIYDTLLKKHKRKYHELIGLYLEEHVLPHQPIDAIEPLALHYSKTRDALKAIRYLCLAGEKSARLYANAQALEHYEKALSYLKDSHLVDSSMVALDLGSQEWQPIGLVFLSVLESQIDIYWLTGEYELALNTCEKALEKKEGLSPLFEARIALYRGRILEKQSQWDDALVSLNHGKDSLEKYPQSLEMAKLLNAQGWVHYRMKDYKDALKSADQALTILNHRPDMEEIAYAHNILGVVHFQKNALDDALNSYQKSLSYQEKIHDEWGVANSLSNMGSVFVMTNQWPKASEHFLSSLDIRERLGDLAGVATSCNNLGHIYQQMSDNEGAVRALEKALHLYLKLNNKFGYAIAYCNLGLVNLKLGYWAPATQNLTKGVEFLRELNADEVLPEAINGLIETALHQGLLEEAFQWIQEVKAHVKKYADPIQKGRYERLKGEYSLQKGQHKKALNYFNKARALLEPMSHSLECLFVYHQLYRCHLALENQEEAEVWLRDYDTLFDSLSQAQQKTVSHLLKAVIHSK